MFTKVLIIGISKRISVTYKLRQTRLVIMNQSARNVEAVSTACRRKLFAATFQCLHSSLTCAYHEKTKAHHYQQNNYRQTASSGLEFTAL